jgi:formate hydrogenlyase transcriptional activator
MRHRLPAQRPLTNGIDATTSPTTAAGHHRLLLDIANLLATKLDPEVLFDTIAQVVRQFLNIDRASLALYDPDRDAFEIVAIALHEGSRFGKGLSIPHTGSRTGKAFDSRQPFLSTLCSGSVFFEDPPLLNEGMHTGLVIPMIADSKPIGTFNVNFREERAMSQADIDLLAAVANQIGIALANSRAFHSMRQRSEGLERQNEYLQELVQLKRASLLVNCPSMRTLLDRLMTLAKVDATVLIAGETGTGKGVLARTLHEWSARRRMPFVKCDCAALTPSLIESELFGHEKGAFTGAHVRRIGRFELANGGTIFLDEIAEMPLPTQAKLLGVLQDRQVQRVGGAASIHVDIRVIAASNRDLRAEVDAGRFREDLFYRLNVLTVRLPPLRERPEDLRPLTDHFIRVFNRTLGRSVTAISPGAMASLTAYSWPGNVRELENVLERAVLLSRGSVLELEEVLAPPALPAAPLPAARTELLTLAEVEAHHIRAVLAETRWQIAGEEGAARILGLHPNTLRSRMEKLGIRRKP